MRHAGLRARCKAGQSGCAATEIERLGKREPLVQCNCEGAHEGVAGAGRIDRLDARRGVIVMPTGTGKTEVALSIMARTAVSTLVVSPVRDLMYQWHRRILAGLGFPALATSSGASAGVLGKRDGQVTREEALAHARAIVGATELPVSADLEGHVTYIVP